MKTCSVYPESLRMCLAVEVKRTLLVSGISRMASHLECKNVSGNACRTFLRMQPGRSFQAHGGIGCQHNAKFGQLLASPCFALPMVHMRAQACAARHFIIPQCQVQHTMTPPHGRNMIYLRFLIPSIYVRSHIFITLPLRQASSSPADVATLSLSS